MEALSKIQKIIDLLKINSHKNIKDELHKNKKGVPLYSNLVNLKSNTMKNTVQKYYVLIYFATFYATNIHLKTFYNTQGPVFKSYLH